MARSEPLISLDQADSLVVGICDSGLVPEQRTGWRPAWTQLQALGRVAERPLLAELRASRADDRLGLLLTAALGVAVGGSGDDRLMEQLSQAGDRRIDRRRHLILLELLALGPERPGDPKRLTAFALRGDLEPLQQVAACLALARYPDAEIRVPARWYRSSDPGLAAAVRRARPIAEDRQWAGWRGRQGVEARLVQRGYLLGGRSDFLDSESAEWAIDVLDRRGGADSELRRAALLHLARTADPDSWLESAGAAIDIEDLAWLVAEPDCRRQLMRRGLLQPPPERLAGVSRLRIALAFALECGAEEMRAARPRWRSDEAASIFCLGLAWRALRSPGEVERSWLEALPSRPERAWVGWACGDSESAPPFASQDRLLDAAFAAVREGRMSPVAAMAAIEAALWRRGAHLAAPRSEAERLLVRDLLMAGSDHAGPLLGSLGGYLPKGLSAGDPAFEVAFELQLFFAEPGPRPPVGLRLQ